MLEISYENIKFSTQIDVLFFLAAVQSAFGKEWPVINLTDLNASHLPPPVKITIENDPVYQIRKVYEGYPLKEILKKVPAPRTLNTEETVIVFTASDGYEVSMPYNHAIREQGYIAFRDHDAPGNKKWMGFKFGKKLITPAPYYLVWPKKGLDKWKYPWPFQLVKISFQPVSEYFGAAVPSRKNTHVKNGFNLFSQYCISCHSMNLSGGEVGPELNIPRNITEYFKENELAGFILNAPSYRAGTKMPVFDSLISSEFWNPQAIFYNVFPPIYQQ